MSNQLKVTFDDPEHGWVRLTISDIEIETTIIASYTPHNSFLDLTNTLHKMLLYESSAIVIWSEEPAEFEMRFDRKEEIICLEIWRYPDHRRGVDEGERVLAVAGKFQDICIPFWRALRDLQGRFTAKELDKRWHRPFPSEEMNKLTAEIKKA